MSYVQLSEGGFQVVYPLGLACGPGSPELSKSNLDLASTLFTLHLHLHASSSVQQYHAILEGTLPTVMLQCCKPHEPLVPIKFVVGLTTRLNVKSKPRPPLPLPPFHIDSAPSRQM